MSALLGSSVYFGDFFPLCCRPRIHINICGRRIVSTREEAILLQVSKEFNGEPSVRNRGQQQLETNMRLIHSMTTIAECSTPDYSLPNRAIKIAVLGAGGVGKTGKRTQRQWKLKKLVSVECVEWCSTVTLCSFSALVVRFLTRRFIGDYERNAGEFTNTKFE